MREYLLCLAAAAAVTYLTVPLARALALRWGALAEVRDRDVHDTPTPRLGGLAMLAGLIAGLLLASKLPQMSSVFTGEARAPLALLGGVGIIVALGLVDDRWGLAAPTKLAGQVLAASVMALQGISIIWLPFGGTLVLDPVTSVLLTVLVVLVCINAINMVDGLDGLAAGIVAVAALAFFAYSYLLSVEVGFERATLATLISALLVGMCVGFLPYNVYPARIFMGDTGSMLLGFLMAAAIITLSGQIDPSAIEGGTLLPALLPILLPLAVHLLEDHAEAVVAHEQRQRRDVVLLAQVREELLRIVYARLADRREVDLVVHLRRHVHAQAEDVARRRVLVVLEELCSEELVQVRLDPLVVALR